jgi:hypothetical protein
MYNGNHLGSYMSEESTRPSVNASERVDEGQEQQQSQEVEEEQEERNRNGSRKGDNDSRDSGEHHKNSTDQYSNTRARNLQGAVGHLLPTALQL